MSERYRTKIPGFPGSSSYLVEIENLDDLTLQEIKTLINPALRRIVENGKLRERGELPPNPKGCGCNGT